MGKPDLPDLPTPPDPPDLPDPTGRAIHRPDPPGLLGIVAAMPTLTDAELKQLMKQLARAQGWDLTDERVDSDLAAFKGYLAANEKIRAVPLPLEAEPFVKLKR